MAANERIKLRWVESRHDTGDDQVDDDDDEPASPPARVAPVAAVAPSARATMALHIHHAIVDAITAVGAASGLLCDRWDELTDDQRRELAHAIKRRAEELRGCLDRSAR